MYEIDELHSQTPTTIPIIHRRPGNCELELCDSKAVGWYGMQQVAMVHGSQARHPTSLDFGLGAANCPEKQIQQQPRRPQQKAQDQAGCHQKLTQAMAAIIVNYPLANKYVESEIVGPGDEDVVLIGQKPVYSSKRGEFRGREAWTLVSGQAKHHKDVKKRQDTCRGNHDSVGEATLRQEDE